MKNTKIMAVLVVLLAAMLFVGAASAADYNYRNVSNNGGLAFVYETINVSVDKAVMGSEKPVLIKFSEGSNPTSVNTIYGEWNGENNATFTLYDTAVGSNYGTYYATTNYSNASKAGSVSIWYPELTLKAELATVNGPTDVTTSGDSIDGKSITKNTNVAFLIDAPRVGPAYDETNFAAAAQIMFTTPAAGKTTYFGNFNFDKTNLTATQVQANATNATGDPYNYAFAGSDAAAGTYTAYAEFKAFNVDGDKKFSGFKDNAEKSNTITFTVQSTTLTLTAGKDSVIRSTPFTVDIQGDSNALYFVYLDGASASDVNPTLQPGQAGMKSAVDSTLVPTYDGKAVIGTEDASKLVGTYGFFETDASGKRTIQYNTNASTEDKSYTVKVYAIKEKWSNAGATYSATSDYDTVKVKVEKGAVTITAGGDGAYYIGQEIKLSGTNSDSDVVYLFITGPNLASDGVILKKVGERLSLKEKAEARSAELSDTVSVKTDDSWEYKWDTSNCNLNTGSYTIYATSVLTNGRSSSESGDAKKLSDSEYATVSVNLKQPFLSAVPSGTVVAKGDDIYIRGTAEGEPSKLQLYIFGPNKFVYESITVEDDGTYEKKLNIGSDWASSQYYVVIEHPMYNGEIDVKYDETTGDIFIKNVDAENSQSSFNVNKLQSSNAADALTKMIDNPNIDDVYTKLTFTVVPAMITINNPGDQGVGTKFTISGTTNLAVDDQILVEVVSSSFNAVDKTSTSTTSGISMTTKVVAGEGTDNVWSVEVDTTNWKLDEYTIKASGIEVDVSTTTNFNVVEKVEVTPTATATGATPTTTATATATTAPTQTPGFGAFIALAGLGAVALLVLRRN